MKKLFWFVITLPIMLIPVEIFIACWIFLKPITFWQRLITIILGYIFLPTIQTVLFIVWLAFLVSIFEQIDSDKRKSVHIKDQKKIKRKK